MSVTVRLFSAVQSVCSTEGGLKQNQILRKGRLPVQNFSADRVFDHQQIGMEGLPSKGCEGGLGLRAELPRLGLEPGAVNLVAHQRMAEMGEMDADLVGPSGLELAGEQGRDWLAVHAGEGFQLLVANLDYSDYLGRIAFGKIVEGKITVGDAAICRHGNGKITKNKVTMLYHFEGMKRIEIQEAHAGDIVGVAGFEDVFIGETICDSEARQALPYIPIDPPTIQMEFAVNDGPLAGQDGKLVTARHIWDRLTKEIRTNVALRIAQTSDPKIFAVSGRGEMQIAILVEQMRREGYEVLVSRPEVLWKKGPNGEPLEPIEKLFVEIPSENLCGVMENLSNRKAQITNMNHVGNQVSVEALVPMRGLIGFETDLVNMTKGMGVMSHLFHEYGEDRGEIAAACPRRPDHFQLPA